MGFLIRDLHKHIVELHQKQYIEHTHMKSFTVFRGQGLPKADFDRMMKTQGGLLSFNNFLSTTMDHQVSLAFAESNQSNPDLIGILFAITINPSISNTAFANVHEVSYFKVEKEILFSMHSIFRIGSMKQINGNNRLWQVDLTLTSDSDPDLYALTEQMRKETEGSTGWLRLVKLMIKLGQYKVAEDLCGILLAQKMNDDETGNVLFQLGLIKLRQEEHLEALTFYEKSLEIRQKHLSSQRPAVAECYNDIGLVYKKMGQYSNALSYYQKALKIRQETLPPDHSDIAESYNNIVLFIRFISSLVVVVDDNIVCPVITGFFFGDFSNKSYHQDSESSSVSSSCMETGTDGQNDLFRQQDVEDDDDENDNIRSSLNPNSNNTMILTYKCSLCEFTSNVPWNVQKHINDLHPGQSNAHMLTQCRSAINDKNQKLLTKKSKHKSGNQTTIATVTKIPIRAPLSPTTALAKAKFSPAVEEALLSLQGSKLNAGLYAVQPKFGIKRLKCQHCFYRSNWKTDMIRHVRIRHNLTEPDHNKDMILMSEQEARATIETYENTFGKELRRRTFRTWNDWAKAEEEFTPKDGSLQYSNINSGTLSDDNNKPKKNPVITGQTILSSTTTTNDEIKRINKTKVKHASKTITQNNIQPLLNTKEFKQLPNPSNIVSRLLLTTSPSQNNDDDAPLDLSLKSSSTIKPNQQSLSSKEIIQQNGDINNQEKQYMDDDLDDEDEEENSDGTSTVTYICSVCPYKSSSLSSVQHHLIIHLTGQGVICPLCSYATSSPNSMIRHMKIVHPTSQTIIEFQSATRITNANIIEQHQCPLCPHQCERSEALDLHRRLEHDDEEFDIDSSSDTGDVDNEDGMESDDIQMQFDKNNNLFQCPVCTPSSNTNNYSNLEQFTMHVFTNHINYMHNNQSCPFCSFIAHTTSKYSLTEHIKLHFNGTLVQPDPIVGIENVKELLIE
ncbi:unnamed protein product [Rotaria sp. Silwood2]|nr:unnamed protein product [Rotaria sp. Silwood2]